MPIGAGGYVTGIVSTSAGDTTAIYARTDVGGAYRWNAASGAWEQMLRTDALSDGELGPSDYSVVSIAVAPTDPDVVYALVGNDYNPEAGGELVGNGRVLSSRDGGRTWRASTERWFASGNQRYRVGSERLAIDPGNPNRAYLGTQREGLWKTDDGGLSWSQEPLSQIPTGVGNDPTLDQPGVSLVAFGPANSAEDPMLHVGVANVGIFSRNSTDESWNRLVALSAGDVPSSSNWSDDEHVLSVNTPDGPTPARLLRIDSSGHTIAIKPPATSGNWHLAVDPFDPLRMVLAGDAVRDGHFWTSSNGGSTWRSQNVEISSAEIPWLEQTDLETWMSTGRLMFDPVVPDRLWFAEGMGVWVTDDLNVSTVSWTSVAQGIEQLVVSGGTSPPGRPVIMTVADRQGFRFERTDSYAAAPLVDQRFASGSGIDFSTANPDVIAWVGAESNIPFSPDRGPRGAVSSDGGSTWREMGDMSDDMYGGEVAVSASDPDNIVWLPTHANPTAYLQDPLPVYISNDRGRSWIRATVGGRSDSFHRFFWWFGRKALAADRVDGAFYLMSNEESFYVSRDGGRNWKQASHSPPCSVEDDCHVFGQVLSQPGVAGSVWAATGEGGLYRSDDAGESAWTKVPGLDEVRLITFGASLDGESGESAVYAYGRTAPGSEFNFYRSLDDATTWSEISTSPFHLAMDVNTLVGDASTPGRIYVGFAGGGVVVGDLS